MTNSPSAGLPVIGLVGGIGSGKSAVARGLAARRPFLVIDADALGHQALKHPPIKQQIQERFGQEVFDSTGEIDRSRLARLVFGTENTFQQAREDLNQIVHPFIGTNIQQQIETARQQVQNEPGSWEGVLLDAAILLETGWGRMCDAIVFVEAEESVREQRVQDTRGWKPADRTLRENNQLNLQAKRAAADAVIDNTTQLNLAIDELEQFFASQFLPGESSET